LTRDFLFRVMLRDFFMLIPWRPDSTKLDFAIGIIPTAHLETSASYLVPLAKSEQSDWLSFIRLFHLDVASHS
jgi:hypothetical protein